MTALQDGCEVIVTEADTWKRRQDERLQMSSDWPHEVRMSSAEVIFTDTSRFLASGFSLTTLGGVLKNGCHPLSSPSPRRSRQGKGEAAENQRPNRVFNMCAAGCCPTMRQQQPKMSHRLRQLAESQAQLQRVLRSFDVWNRASPSPCASNSGTVNSFCT